MLGFEVGEWEANGRIRSRMEGADIIAGRGD